jgi:hypothetical protein
MKKEAMNSATVTGLETVPVFSLAERNCHWDLARTFMERNGLDAILAIGEHEKNNTNHYQIIRPRQYHGYPSKRYGIART